MKGWQTVYADDYGDTQALLVPGGMIVKHVQAGLAADSEIAVAMVFVPHAEGQTAADWIKAKQHADA